MNTLTSYVVAPRLRCGATLCWAYDEDETTAAWDALQAASLPPGTAVAVTGIDLPHWFAAAAGIQLADDAAWWLEHVDAAAGPVVLLREADGPSDIDEIAPDVLAQATPIDDEQAALLRRARDETPREADFPLGAHVPPDRHDAVLVERLRFPQGRVVTWTRIGAGAAPTEFQRRQEAMGAYHVVMVEAGGRRTVGIWAGPNEPTTGEPCRPVLRRLLRQQGAWRHGVSFRPPS